MPDYNICLPPGLTSTPFFEEPKQGTSSDFIFKKPVRSPSNAVLSTALKDKCNSIAPPLHGLDYNGTTTVNNGHFKDDLIINDKVCKDSGLVYTKIMEFRDENAKLRAENAKLLEKCVTNDGEVSILRTQLKNNQAAADNARMEKVRAQERIEMDYTQKLTASKNECQNLRTQLDFKVKILVISKTYIFCYYSVLGNTQGLQK